MIRGTRPIKFCVYRYPERLDQLHGSGEISKKLSKIRFSLVIIPPYNHECKNMNFAKFGHKICTVGRSIRVCKKITNILNFFSRYGAFYEKLENLERAFFSIFCNDMPPNLQNTLTEWYSFI